MIFKQKKIPILKKILNSFHFFSVQAKVKAYLDELPPIEKIIFKQCESDTKNTVELAKCAWKVIKQRRYVRNKKKKEEERLREKEEYYNTMQVKKPIIYSTKDNLYTTHQKVRYNAYRYWNPIRPQKRKNTTALYLPRRGKREDPIIEAWDLFLEEERQKKKNSMKKTKISAVPTTVFSNFSKPSSDLERNFLGLPRHIKHISKRQKRKIDGLESNLPLVFHDKQVDPSKEAPIKPVLKNEKKTTAFGKVMEGLFAKRSKTRHLQNLQTLKEHFDKVEEIKNYYKVMNDENKRLFKKLRVPIDSQEPQLKDNVTSVLMDILDLMNNFKNTQGFDTLSIMSPRLFPIFPDQILDQKNRLLSPTVLSFHKEGFFSLPDIFNMLTSEKKYQHIMLDLLLEASGAADALEGIINKMSEDMRYVSEVQYPLLMEMKEHDDRWEKAKRNFTPAQRKEYKKYGYTYMNDEQLGLVYKNPRFTIDTNPKVKEFAGLSREQKEMKIEEMIREIAEVDHVKWPNWNERIRSRRATDTDGEEPDEHSKPGHTRINGVGFVTLHPTVFTNIVSQGIAVEVVTLSPQAFLGEILMPEALALHTLSPRAFIATILSPSALIARILSPTALRAEVLAPRALTAWVLSPEAMIAEVLTPRFLEPRVLSPEALVIDVLSPGILAPHIMSSEMIGVMVLSPNILSPRINSEEKLLVEILSPHILGGPHNKDEKEHLIHDRESAPSSHSAENHSEDTGGGHHGIVKKL